MLQLISIVCTIYFFIKAFSDKKQAKASMTWPSIEGQIMSVGKNFSGFPKVTYSYQAGGITKTAQKLFFAQMVDRDFAKEINQKYKIGDPVKVYYDPASPLNAVLMPGFVKGEGKALKFAIGLAIFNILLIFFQAAVYSSKGY